MKRAPVTLRSATVGLLVLLTASAIASCGDSHECPTSGDDNWYNLGFDVEVSDPSTCPVTIYGRGTAKGFGGSYFGPLQQVQYPDGSFTFSLTTAYNSQAQAVSPDVETDYFDDGLGDGDGESDVGLQYAAATGFDPTDNIQGATAALGGTATGYVDISYTITYAANIAGPTSINPGRSTTWTGSWTNNPDPLTFRWARNDTMLSGQTNSTYSFSPTKVGNLKLATYTTDSKTGAKDSIFEMIGVTFGVTINGPSSVLKPGGSCTWTAVATGGVSPVTYSWTFDNRSAGSGASLSEDIATSPHTISVSVTDGSHNTAFQNIAVNLVSSGGTACEQ